MVWLDQVNAYDSMLHELIEVAMNTYHVPLHEKKIVGDYYYGIEIGYTFRTTIMNLNRIYVWEVYGRRATTGKGDCDKLHKSTNICDGNKLDGDSNRKKNKRTKEEVR